MKIIDLEQGSPEWLEWRETVLTASEAPAVMGVNPWFPKTPYQLYLLKTGQKEVHYNNAMKAGNDNESRAIELLNEKHDLELKPMCGQRGRFSASFDGFDGNVVGEVKCVQSSSPAWEKAQSGDAGHYIWQLIHQVYVADAVGAIFGVYSIDLDEIITIEFDTSELKSRWHDELEPEWIKYMTAVDNFDAPEMTEADTIEREDTEWSDLAQRYNEAKEAFSEAKNTLDDLKKQLIDLAGGLKSSGAGVSVYPVERKGAIDYKSVPELDGVNLDDYRKKSTQYWSVK